MHAHRARDEIGGGDDDFAIRCHDPVHDVHRHAHRPRHFVGCRGNLGGLICKRDGLAPDQAEAAGIEIVADRAVAKDVDRRQFERHHLLAIVDQAVEALSQRFAVVARTEHGLHRVHLRTVPIGIENSAELRNDGAYHKGVHVHEILRCAAHEIFVGDVAASCDDHGSIRDEQLVVHAMIEPAELANRRGVFAGNALPGAAERIEQADLDVRKRRQPAEHRIAADRVKVVHQQTHAHAAQCGVSQIAHQQAAGAVVLNQVVLDVERVPCPARKLDPRVERVDAERHQSKSRQLRRRARVPRDPDQRALGRGLQRR